VSGVTAPTLLAATVVTEAAPRVLFVTHCGQLSGAELVLCDIVRSHLVTPNIFLFEDGPLRSHFEATGLRAAVSPAMEGLSRIRRSGSLSLSVPLFGKMLRTLMHLTRCARQHEVVYANSQKAFILAAFAAELAGRPLIWHLHDIMTEQNFGPNQIRLAIAMANAIAARVIVPSEAAAHAFVAAGGRAGKLRVVPNGISVPEETRPLDRRALREELDLPEGFLINITGRLAPWKGQHVMLQALAMLPEAKCIIVGSAMFGEDAYAESLRRQAEPFGDRVKFLGYRADVPRLMRASDIVIHTSVEPEPFGRVLVEAMLCGTPVGASRLGGVPEILGDHSDALLYTAGDAADLARMLRNFMDHGDRSGQLVDDGQQRAQRLFSVSRMQREVSSLILELCARPA
jgi:glycosyltransferase involved in cell wall biosynthesis